MEFHLEDYWNNDYKPGYVGNNLSPLDDAANINGNANLDFSPAFNRLLQDLWSRTTVATPLQPARVLFDKRNCYHFYSTLEVDYPVEFVGYGVHFRNSATRLLFHGCTGIHQKYPQTATYHLGGGIVQGVNIEYVGSNKAEENHHGIHASCITYIKNTFVKNFPGNGIHFEATLGDPNQPNANVSLSSIQECSVYYCGKSGVWISGKDAQVMSIRSVNSFVNGQRKIAEDGFGFFDSSMLGNTYEACHTRNNYVCGYRGTRYLGVAPNRSTFINCYSEHAPLPDLDNFQEGVSIIDAEALIITSNADGCLADAIGGAIVVRTAQGQLRVTPGLEVIGNSQVSATLCSPTVLPDTDKLTARVARKSTSKVYGTAPVDVSTLYEVHDPNPVTRAWGLKINSPGTLMALGVTDSKHFRPAMAIAPKGILIGTTPNKTLAENGVNDGARRLGYLDGRYESSLSTQFPNALVGDRVFNQYVHKVTHNFGGWVFGIDTDGTKKWFRTDENLLGIPVLLFFVYAPILF